MTSDGRISLTFLVNCFDLSGAETIIARTIKGLDRKRYAIKVIALQQRGGAFARLLQSMDIDSINLNVSLVGALPALTRLARMMRGVDVLHTATFHSQILGRIVGRLMGVPVIFGAEVIMDFEPRRHELLNRWTAGMQTLFICNAEAVRRYVIDRFHVPPEKAVTVYQGVDIGAYPMRRQPREPQVIGTVGRLHRQKGYPHMVAAAALLRRTHPNVRWRCVGDGPERMSIAADIQARGLTDVVELCGYSADMPHNLSQFDIYVQGAIAEGLSYATLEAMATGLPVVATDVGGTRELIEDGISGVIIPPADPAAMATAIAGLLTDRDRASALGRSARERVARHFHEQTMATMEDRLIRHYLPRRDALGDAH